MAEIRRTEIRFALPLIALIALPSMDSISLAAAPSHRNPPRQAFHAPPTPGVRLPDRITQASSARGPGANSISSVPDGTGGQYIAWPDFRDGTFDIYVLRVTNSGAPELGWPADGVLVCNAPGQQFPVDLVPDGANGVIVTWFDNRDDWQFGDVYARQVSAAGVAGWAANGVKLVEGGLDFSGFAVVSDGAGGLIAAWSVGLFDPNVYATRLTALGTLAPGWDSNGELICDDPEDQFDLTIAPDGTGGAVIAWTDYRTPSANVFAQRIDATGTTAWTANGIQIDAAVAGASNPAAVPTSLGHVLLFWSESSAGRVAGQRLDATGTGVWTAGGVTLRPPGLFTALEVLAVSDGANGALVTWQSEEAGFEDFVAQRVNGSGAVQWGASGVALVGLAAANPEDISFAPDGSGGAFFAWGDRRNGDHSDVYAQHVTSAGLTDWGANGVAASATARHQLRPSLVADGLGGALISWEESRNQDQEVYSQRISSAGVAQLTPDGEPTYVNPGVQYGPFVLQTADGGALTVWAEKRNNQYDLRARKLAADGNPAGPAKLVSAAPGHKVPFGFVDDGAGGGIVGWSSEVGEQPDLFAQRIDGDGNPLWTANGVEVCVAPDFQGSPQMVSDGSGGAIFSWYDARVNSNPDVYGQRLNSAGVAQWAPNGTAVCADPGVQDSPVLAPDGAGGAIFAWPDRRIGAPWIYAQRMNAAGVAQWAANGLLIADYSGSLTAGAAVVAAVPGGANEVIVLIVESDFNILTFQSFSILHAQKVNGAGAPQWGTEGSSLCDVGSFTFLETMIPDGFGGAIVGWCDTRNGTFDIFGQRVNSAGGVIWDANGNVVCDAPSWQQLGGMTRFNNDPLFSWTDERSGLPDVYAHRMTNAGADVWTADGVVVSDQVRGQYVASLAPWKTATPERFFVGFTDNRAGDARYVFVQRLDSNGGSIWALDGVVDAQIALASFEASPERVLLVWHSSESVTATIYRRAFEGDWVEIGSAATDGTGRIEFEDRDVVPGERYGYRLGIPGSTGEAFHGEVWVDVPSQLALALHGLQPSPAVRELVVSFTLPRRDDARIELLDLAGRRVLGRDLVGLAPGRHTLRLDGALPASGMYFLRLTQNERTVTARAPVMK